MVDEINHRVASLFKNLGNGIRITVLEHLHENGEENLTGLGDLFGRTNSTMSRHLKILSDYDLTESETRGRKKFFRIKRPELVEACLSIRSYLTREDDHEQ